MRYARTLFLALGCGLFALFGTGGVASAQDGYSAYSYGDVGGEGMPSEYTQGEILDAGHAFFGSVTGSLATLVERAFAKHGQPNGYVLGQEGSGALIGGVKYGEGMLHTRNAGEHMVYWRGPSIGWDIGASGTRVMMLIYNLPSVDGIFRQYNGVNTSAFLVGGVGLTVLENTGTYVVPIKSGVGARLGFNLGYLKFSDHKSWNPF